MLDLVIDARKADLGGGIIVSRILPFRSRRMVGPFIFLDHAGPLAIAPDKIRDADVRPHPHIGLSTVSYLFGGQVTHRDSLGVEQVIRPGEVNWMTAGRGISHSSASRIRRRSPAARWRCCRPGWRCRRRTRKARPPSPTTSPNSSRSSPRAGCGCG